MIRGNITSWMGRPEHPVLCHLHLPPRALADEPAGTSSEPAPSGKPASALEPNALETSGAVILLPPLGREQVASYRTMRQLGDALAGKGMVAVRLGWSGQADSAPIDEQLSLLENWTADLAGVVDELRQAGITQVHLVGLRLGALLAARQATAVGADSVLLWDAPPSGKNFLRHEQIMYTSQGLGTEGGAFHALGYTLRPGDADELRGLKLKELTAALEGSSTVVGQLTRGDRSQPGPGGRWSTDEMPAMLETSSMTARVANHAISSIVTWCLARCGSNRSRFSFQPCTEATITVARPDGSTAQVTESLLQLESGLPAILTEPLSSGQGTGSQGTATGDVAVLFTAASSEPLDGPSGLWTLAARKVAADGGVALRSDKFGTGERGGPLPTDPLPYLPGFTDDVAEAADWLTRHAGSRPIGVGLCSGTYFQMVRPNAARFERVVGINLLGFDRDPADIPDEVAMATDPSHVMVTADAGPQTDLPLRRRVRSEVKSRMPQPLWRMLGRVGLAHAPDDFLREAAQDTDLVLAFSPDDHEAFQGQRGEAALDWARRHGGPIRVFVDPQLDHGLFGAPGRRRTLEIIGEEVGNVRRLRAARRRAEAADHE